MRWEECVATNLFDPAGDMNEIGDKTGNFALEDGSVAENDVDFIDIWLVLLPNN